MIGIGAKLLTNDILSEMFDSDELAPQDYDNQVYRTAIAICHNAIRRSSEPLCEQFGGLKCENIIFVGGPDEYTPAPKDDMNASAIMVFLFSKKNQLGLTQSAPLLHLCQHGIVCGYCHLLVLYSWRIPNNLWKPSDPIFWLKNKSILNYRKFNKKLKDCGEAIGYARFLIQPHGLRGAGNIDLKLIGAGPNTRQIIAGWKDPKTRLKYERKMEPHHLHQCLAKDLGLHSIKILNGRTLQRICNTRSEKLLLRKKRVLKQLKKQKKLLNSKTKNSKRISARNKLSWTKRKSKKVS